VNAPVLTAGGQHTRKTMRLHLLLLLLLPLLLL
jgi:hypothetical protein